MKDILETMIKNLVTDIDSVSVTETLQDNELKYQVRVNEKDIGRIIGKRGKVAQSIRTIVKAVAAKENKKMINIDGLLYIVGSIPMFIITITLLLTNFIMYNSASITTAELIKNVLFYLVPTFILPILVGIFAMWLDGRKIKPMAKGLLCYPLFLLTWIFINFKCLFIRNTSWEKINHVRSIKISDVSNGKTQTEKELI